MAGAQSKSNESSPQKKISELGVASFDRYKLIRSTNLADFNLQCNQLSVASWTPVFEQSVIKLPNDNAGIDGNFVYFQQWKLSKAGAIGNKMQL